MAVKVVPLVCKKCGNHLDPQKQEQVFICDRCLLAHQTVDAQEQQIKFRSYQSDRYQFFIPFYILTGNVIEHEIFLLDMDHITSGMSMQSPLDFSISDIRYQNREVNYEILETAGYKLSEAKIPKPPYTAEVWIPAFQMKNLLQYGLKYGLVNINVETELEKTYRNLDLPVIINSQEAYFIGKNLIQNNRARENNFIHFIDFSWELQKQILVAIGFSQKQGFYRSEELKLEIPLNALK
ncbi:MAG: hypothetical protein APR63_12565 [Desulfuromonas sp. SDB]|nr:MAG: hypothetical protein APR63_12565 [Desulfuromonas sp. SDB]